MKPVHQSSAVLAQEATSSKTKYCKGGELQQPLSFFFL